MQRQRYSKILQSDYSGMPDRAVGMPILQSHGNLVSRGDLITQDNISVPNVFTITINKNNFSQLCTVGDPGQLTSYDDSLVNGNVSKIVGSVTTDQNGIYASSYGSGSGWHGPVFYTQLPSAIGMSGQYWHIVFKYTTQNPLGYMLGIWVRIGFSTQHSYHDGWSGDNEYRTTNTIYNSATSNQLYSSSVFSDTANIVYKFYHYPDNTIKLYQQSQLKFNSSDPIPLDTGDNMLTIYIAQGGGYPVPYHRIQEITVSTDPTYDPQP